MDIFDFNSPAEVFTIMGRFKSRGKLSYTRFDTAAQAVRFVIEELPSNLLNGTTLESSEDRFDKRKILQLYNRQDYPLERRPPS